jgi:hypothetical protein
VTIADRPPAHNLLDELKWVHGMLRRDLAVCRELAGRMAAGGDPAEVTGRIRALQTSSPLWQLRTDCLHYCRSCTPTTVARTQPPKQIHRHLPDR